MAEQLPLSGPEADVAMVDGAPLPMEAADQPDSTGGKGDRVDARERRERTVRFAIAWRQVQAIA